MAQDGGDRDVPLAVLKEGREIRGNLLWGLQGFSSRLEASCRSDLVSAPPAPGDGRRIQLGVKMAGN